jgi:hypothetical protein
VSSSRSRLDESCNVNDFDLRGRGLGLAFGMARVGVSEVL